nr:conserved plasmid protein [Cupriavidus malaysiensis]
MTLHPSDSKASFDEAAWRDACDSAAKEANRGSGQSYDYYVDRFSADIDRGLHVFNEADRPRALEIAQEWGYETAEEREETRQWNSRNGYCSHGITLGCCPAGCGSGPDD